MIDPFGIPNLICSSSKELSLVWQIVFYLLGKKDLVNWHAESLKLWKGNFCGKIAWLMRDGVQRLTDIIKCSCDADREAVGIFFNGLLSACYFVLFQIPYWLAVNRPSIFRW